MILWIVSDDMNLKDELTIANLASFILANIGLLLHKEKDDFIKLGQALKLAGLVGSGVDAKFVIQDGLVKVNGEVETQRGKKLYPGDTVSYDGKTFKVEK